MVLPGFGAIRSRCLPPPSTWRASDTTPTPAPMPEMPEFATILKLNAQFSQFTTVEQFSHFVKEFMESLSSVGDCQRVLFGWFMSSFDLLPPKKMEKALKMAHSG